MGLEMNAVTLEGRVNDDSSHGDVWCFFVFNTERTSRIRNITPVVREWILCSGSG